VEQIRKAGGARGVAGRGNCWHSAGSRTIQPTAINLIDVIAGIENYCRGLSERTWRSPRTWRRIWGWCWPTPGRMEQVILNLAVNSRDAMPDGGKLTIQARNTRLLQGVTQGKTELKPGEYVELTVGDTGAGMPTEVQAHIFEPFFTTKPAGKGTGLGLSTVYGIVQQAGGHVTFESAPGAGTTSGFFCRGFTPRPRPPLRKRRRRLSCAGRRRVLLCEDDASVCELVRTVLTSQGYTVLAAKQPQEAESICRENGAPRGHLVDGRDHARKSGPELAKKIAESNSHIRVLYMSGYIDDSLLRQEIQEQGTAYLQKPFSPLSLAKKVREVLDSLPVR